MSDKRTSMISFAFAAAGLVTTALGQATESQLDAQPVLSQHDHWAVILVLIIILGFFVPAAIFGPYLRRRTASAMPELHAAQEHDAHTAAQHEPGHDAPLFNAPVLEAPVPDTPALDGPVSPAEV